MGDGPALLESVVPVLHAQPAENRMRVVRHVAGREHVRQRCPATRIHEDAVVDLRPGRREKLGVWHDTDPGHDQVALDDSTLGRAHALHTAVTFEGSHGILGDQAHTLFTVNTRQNLTDLLADNADQRHAPTLDGGHLDAELAQRGRHLGADESEAHHDHAPAPPDGGADPVAILDGPELEDTG